MRPEDLDEVLEIERASFSMPWSRGAFLYEMQQNRVARCWALREGARVVGYLCLWEVADEVHITNIAVRPDCRRRGLGRTLLGGILDEARQRRIRLVVLEVRPSNTEARTLYESFGFRVVGRRRGNYYDTAEDALVIEGALPTADGVAGTLTGDPARPQAASGTVKVDMNLVRTGVDKRDADMRGKNFLDTEVEANRWVTFEMTGVEIAGPLEPGKSIPAKVRGILTVKQKPVERIADATVTWIKLTPEQVENQKRYGFTADNIKVRARLATTFTDHGMQVPQLLIFKVSNDIQLETDLTFARQ